MWAGSIQKYVLLAAKYFTLTTVSRMEYTCTFLLVCSVLQFGSLALFLLVYEMSFIEITLSEAIYQQQRRKYIVGIFFSKMLTASFCFSAVH
jgi:hypothetical protein